MRMRWAAVLVLLAVSARADWPHYGGSPAQTRYSPLRQITPGNVLACVELRREIGKDVQSFANGRTMVADLEQSLEEIGGPPLHEFIAEHGGFRL